MLAHVRQGPAGLQKQSLNCYVSSSNFFGAKFGILATEKGVATGVKGFFGKTWTHVAIFRQ